MKQYLSLFASPPDYPDTPIFPLTFFSRCIAAYVSPLDLIHLSHTSRQLCRLFMSKTSRTTWKTVLGNVPELPPCPGDMCEPLYAALVFGKYCFGCGVEDAFWVDYALRLRVCETCYKANVVEGTEVLKSLPQDTRHIINDVLFMLVPSANIFNFANLDVSFDRINPLYHLQEDFYFKPELEAMLRLLWPVPASKSDVSELKELTRIRANYVMMRQMHAVLIHAWDNLCATSASESDFSRIKSMYRSVEDIQVFGCDWDEVCAPENPVFAGYLSGKGAEENAIVRLRRDPPKPHAQLAAERDTLSQQEVTGRQARLRARRAQVEKWYQTVVVQHPYLACRRAELPNAHDTEGLWESLVSGSDGNARDTFDPDAPLDGPFVRMFIVTPLIMYQRRLVRCLAAELEEYERRHVEDAGASSLTSRAWELSAGAEHEPWTMEWQVDPLEMLVRPTALFACRECGAQPYAFPAINEHWQEAHPDESAWVRVGTGFGGAGEYGAEVWEGAEVAERILEVLVRKGLREGERNMGGLNELVEEGWVYCACGDPTMATPDQVEEDLGWETLVDHVLNHLNDNMLRRKTSPNGSNGAPVWLDDHNLASCIKYLPEDADTFEGNNRVTADDSTRKRVDALLRKCPETSSPACLLCVLTPDSRKDDSLFLMANADAIVYHMEAKHGKHFEDADVVFWDKAVFDTP
ncbi:hypothetical protein GSI_03153 [Ganoderma sinense ZZ0214-1]|uniref:F-box domain-containing protein n=1 Tax=Ganoderma sinense ZZ0214-1 TaxID=1077348 RepID=A0A2G8SLC3_9APHY|nr:hypothetical protein GSI_03153 [Ganoderma sinense ZZ0214-1]